MQSWRLEHAFLLGLPAHSTAQQSEVSIALHLHLVPPAEPRHRNCANHSWRRRLRFAMSKRSLAQKPVRGDSTARVSSSTRR